MLRTNVNNLSEELIPIAVACKAVTIANTAGTLESLGSFTLNGSTRRVVVVMRDNPVNFDPSGNDPTTTVGIPVLVGQIIEMSVEEAKTAKWIRSTGSSGTANVCQYTT